MASEERRYDAAVLGSGPSGRTLSLRLAKNSFSVALVENELVGGDCAYWACIPSKALLRPPEALTEAREVDGSRQAGQGRLSVESVLTRRDKFVDHWNDDNLIKVLEEGGVDKGATSHDNSYVSFRMSLHFWHRMMIINDLVASGPRS
jgi:pyruvate/2-oxoglutarate dehydrogenase complex dihydrolipoamide dehydrogenase (E3) component